MEIKYCKECDAYWENAAKRCPECDSPVEKATTTTFSPSPESPPVDPYESGLKFVLKGWPLEKTYNYAFFGHSSEDDRVQRGKYYDFIFDKIGVPGVMELLRKFYVWDFSREPRELDPLIRRAKKKGLSTEEIAFLKRKKAVS